MGKLLITDDAAFMRMTLKNIVTAAGYEVVAEAANGYEAIEQYKETKPDLVTLDITMPELDGLEALKQIKQHDPDAKIIMCSAMGQQDMVLNAIQNGASDFIVKPFDENRITETIERTLSK
ncbi:response regulator [Texcoconibacillus texcoconensis]|uniref:Two-component system chemotaxis response regulator CheY n=1 Tax=Texcoconibacillus texcoconensis TaxID=1095777 RepID=A0A840QS05_9BACI|nr:response regulator [Texcoconibacillus texcoconensis]MBB5174144.1 two-component system chemotaxis response regulator CheY [Texcoconibacillus texcoconensis]